MIVKFSMHNFICDATSDTIIRIKLFDKNNCRKCGTVSLYSQNTCPLSYQQTGLYLHEGYGYRCNHRLFFFPFMLMLYQLLLKQNQVWMVCKMEPNISRVRGNLSQMCLHMKRDIEKQKMTYEMIG